MLLKRENERVRLSLGAPNLGKLAHLIHDASRRADCLRHLARQHDGVEVPLRLNLDDFLKRQLTHAEGQRHLLSDAVGRVLRHLGLNDALLLDVGRELLGHANLFLVECHARRSGYWRIANNVLLRVLRALRNRLA